MHTQGLDLGLGVLPEWQGQWGHQVIGPGLVEQAPDDQAHVLGELQASDSRTELLLQDRKVLRLQGPKGRFDLLDLLGLLCEADDNLLVQELAVGRASGVRQGLLWCVLGVYWVVTR